MLKSRVNKKMHELIKAIKSRNTKTKMVQLNFSHSMFLFREHYYALHHFFSQNALADEHRRTHQSNKVHRHFCGFKRLIKHAAIQMNESPQQKPRKNE